MDSQGRTTDLLSGKPDSTKPWRTRSPGLLLPSLLLLLLPAGCSPTPSVNEDLPRGTARIPAEGPYHHPYSGITFPTILAGCPRESLSSLTSSGSAVSATYDSWNLFARLSVRLDLFPRGKEGHPLSLEEQFRETLGSYLARTEGAVPVEEEEVELSREDGRASGKSARICYSARMDGWKREVCTRIFLFATDHWFILYRITYPSSQETRVQGKIRRVLQDFRWNVHT